MDGEPLSGAGLVQSFACTSCGSTVTIRAAGHSLSVVCSSCKSVIDPSDENHRILSTYYQKRTIEPLIPLGQKGILKGYAFEVIGFMRRQDISSGYGWFEYLLFNPYQGFRWLVVADGHWNFVSPVKDISRATPGIDTDRVSYNKKVFRVYNRGNTKIDYVLGEFYWQVKVGDQVRTADYICPPYMLSVEKDRKEIVASLCEYMTPNEVQKAFLLEKPLPRPVGVAANQPTPYTHSKALIVMGLIFLFILIGIQGYFNAHWRNKMVYSGDFTFIPNDADRMKVTPSFTLEGKNSAVAISLFSPIQQDWLEVDMSLVNATNNNQISFESGVEYYSGVDPDDGSWSEGNQRKSNVLSSVPGGTYYLTLEASGGEKAQKPYQIRVTNDVPNYSNFILCALSLAVIPCYVTYRSYRFEMARWENSDFSPFVTTGESE